MIYLDSAATTPVNPEVVKVVMDSLIDDWYNPSSRYYNARLVRKKIEDARQTIAECIGAQPREIIFTSGGSESNALALNSTMGQTFAISSVEHESIRRLAKKLKYRILPVDNNGLIDYDYFNKLLEEEYITKVSVQYVNNETGVIQDIPRIVEMVKPLQLIVHTDAVQAFPHLPCNVNDIGVDMMSVSGHKFGAPKGIGFLYAKGIAPVHPLICGTQERERRGGTENVPYILGLAKAVSERYLSEEIEKEKLRVYFESRLKELGCTINCENAPRISSIISCTLPEGVIADYMVNCLRKNEIIVSAGSACHESSGIPSHVLGAIGLTYDQIDRTFRISLSSDTDYSQIDFVIGKMAGYIEDAAGRNLYTVV